MVGGVSTCTPSPELLRNLFGAGSWGDPSSWWLAMALEEGGLGVWAGDVLT